MTILEVKHRLIDILSHSVGQDEAKAMASVIIEDVKGYKPIDVALYGHRELLPETESRMMSIAKRVVDGEPLQYAIGKAMFRGRTFAVTPDTLIPRPETAQLVDIIVKENSGRTDLDILDIGTGTGCIGISLALDLPFANATCVDISQPALDVARGNAVSLKAPKTRFVQADALSPSFTDSTSGPYDIIVSNPPYVLDSESQTMDRRVVDHEPSSALFVPDDNPLIFYKAIGEYAYRNLKPSGTLYFEINPMCATALRSMLGSIGFDDIDIQADYKGNNRFAIVRK